MLDAARWWKDYNSEWAQIHCQPLDEDPVAWYRAFEDMIEAIETRVALTSAPFECDSFDQGVNLVANRDGDNPLKKWGIDSLECPAQAAEQDDDDEVSSEQWEDALEEFEVGVDSHAVKQNPTPMTYPAMVK